MGIRHLVKLTFQISKGKIHFSVNDIETTGLPVRKQILHSLHQIKFLIEEKIKCKK